MRKIILDCDPGHDDAVAILLAAGNPDIELLGLTTVGGNHTIDHVTRNAQQVLTVAGLTSVPVYRGATRPLLNDVVTAEDIHGDTGMEIHGFDLPEPAVPVGEIGAVQWIVDTLMREEPGTVTLVPTGPLTNIALAARLEPRIVPRVREVERQPRRAALLHPEHRRDHRHRPRDGHGDDVQDGGRGLSLGITIHNRNAQE